MAQIKRISIPSELLTYHPGVLKQLEEHIQKEVNYQKYELVGDSAIKNTIEVRILFPDEKEIRQKQMATRKNTSNEIEIIGGLRNDRTYQGNNFLPCKKRNYNFMYNNCVLHD